MTGNVWATITNFLQQNGISLPQINFSAISNQISNLASSALGMIVLVILGIVAVVLLLICAVIGFLSLLWFFNTVVFNVIQSYLLPAIALHKMAKNAGEKHAWFAWIPFLQTHLEYTLPKGDFRILFFRVKGKDRNVMAIIIVALSILLPLIFFFIGKIPVVGGFLMMIPIVLMIVFSWRRKYDVLMLYTGEGTATTVSIIGIVLPLVYAIALLIFRKRTPDYDNF